MRKTIITITVIALILSILSTGLIVFVETAGNSPEPQTSTLSAE